MPEISIVIPVYNAEKYLNIAINSVINQTFKDYELILVDDGSTDKSGAICDEYAEKNKKIHVIHKTNGGICDARNVGLKEATGKYIMFMDNDDEIDLNLLSDNYKLMVENNLDLIKFGREAIYLENNEVKKIDVRKFNFEILKENQLKERKLNLWYEKFFICIWDAMYKKEILEKVQFDTNLKKGGEDIALNLEIFDYLHKVAFSNKVYYKHYIRDGFSTSTKYNSKFLEDITSKFERFNKVFRKNDVTNIELYNVIIVRDFMNVLSRNFIKKECQLSNKQQKEELKKYSSRFLDNNNIFKMIKISKKYTLMYLLYKTNLSCIIKILFKMH